MEDQVVLLGNPKKFVVNSIANSMEKGGLKATVVEMTVNAISHIEEGIGIYILYLEEEPTKEYNREICSLELLKKSQSII